MSFMSWLISSQALPTHTMGICGYRPKLTHLGVTGRVLVPTLYPNHQTNAVLNQLMFYYLCAGGESVLNFSLPERAKKKEIR